MPEPFRTDHLKPRSYNILRSHNQKLHILCVCNVKLQLLVNLYIRTWSYLFQLIKHTSSGEFIIYKSGNKQPQENLYSFLLVTGVV